MFIIHHVLNIMNIQISALKILSDPNNLPAVLNCAHGKDRTGIVAALVLGCLGKPKEFIALEYAKSEVGTPYDCFRLNV